MKNFVLLNVVSVAFVSICFADEFKTDSMKINDKSSTMIYSLISEVTYIPEGQTESVILVSELSGAVVKMEDCKKFDVDKKYSNYHFFQSGETRNPEDPAFEPWFDGQRIEGKIIKKVVDYCLAN